MEIIKQILKEVFYPLSGFFESDEDRKNRREHEKRLHESNCGDYQDSYGGYPYPNDPDEDD